MSWSAVWLSFPPEEACSLETPHKCCVLGHNASHFLARGLLVLQANGGKVRESEEKCAAVAVAVAVAAAARQRRRRRGVGGGSVAVVVSARQQGGGGGQRGSRAAAIGRRRG